jgi:hypothetical protein
MNISATRRALNQINRFLSMANLKLETLTNHTREVSRLREAEKRGDFTRPLYSVPESFLSADYEKILVTLEGHRARFESFCQPESNDVEYTFDNDYMTSPDAEVLYSITYHGQPARILEIGCGHSTRIIRQSIRDAGFNCCHTCVDPAPRREIVSSTDQIISARVESLDPATLVRDLAAGDVLFIDTSHEVLPANDVAYIYGSLLPRLKVGVLVHIHDIFLPYEYPLTWVMERGWKWGEQYIVQAMLTSRGQWEVLWPGYYLQRTLPNFASYFPHLNGKLAQSLWIRRAA